MFLFYHIHPVCTAENDDFSEQNSVFCHLAYSEKVKKNTDYEFRR